jgi:conjugative transposon TraM protein
MEKKTPYTPSFLKRRRFLVALPLLVTPFLTLAFWALGGGKGSAQAINEKDSTGLNLRLPGPQLKEDPHATKLSYYEQAEKDSHKWKEQVGADPFSASQDREDSSQLTASHNTALSYDPAPFSQNGSKNPPEEKIYQRLAQLHEQLEVATKSDPEQVSTPVSTGLITRKVTDFEKSNQFENLLEQQQVENSRVEDGELQQLNGMMERILDIQHPERVKEKMREQSQIQKDKVFPMSTPTAEDSITLLTSDREEPDSNNQPHNRFYGLNEEEGLPQTANSIAAVVHQTQTLVNGATIKLRLLSDVYIQGILVPKDQFVYGIATLSGERLQVHIPSIRYKNHLLPVDLSVYDLDGLAGIYVPGSISREVTSQTTENIVQGLELGTINHSAAGELARAGIDASRSLLSKKARQMKVTVKAGYQVLLRNQQL